MTNQIAAMLFPLVVLAVVGVVAVTVRKPWKRLKPSISPGEATLRSRTEFQEALKDAYATIKRAEDAAHAAGERLTRTFVP